MLAAVTVSGPALAQSSPHAASSSNAPVYIVTSQSSYRGLVGIAGDATAHRDSLGTDLVVARVRADQLGVISELIHTRELRCGGFFAFSTRAAAEAFVRDDRAATALRPRLLAAYTIDNQATVNPWQSQPQATNIYGTISQLSGYQNRYYTSADGKASAEWIRSTWQSLASGRNDVTTELFNCANCSTQPSVILTIQGTDLPSEIVVLGAHLDSINGSAGGSVTQRAPGADDDASGVATLTEVLRVALANGWRPRRTVKFMAYAAEEVGLRGSNAIAQSFKTAGRNVYAVLQLDMTNYKSGSVADMRLIADYSNPDVKTFFAQLFDTYLAPQGFTRGSYTCGYGCSDHASWTSAGYPSGMMFEAGDSGGYFPYIHTQNDTLANMANSAQNSVKFAKFGLAFLGEAAKTYGSAPGNAPPTAGFGVAVSGLTANFTDASVDSDGSIVARSWNFGDGSTSTAINPSKTYAAPGTYTVTLGVTDNAGAGNSRSQAIAVGPNVLNSGVAVALPAQASGTVSTTYALNMPAGKTSVTFAISGGSGDADLYVRVGAVPTTTTYNCRPYLGGNNETCTFNAPVAGIYYANVRAYSAFSGVSLKATISP